MQFDLFDWARCRPQLARSPSTAVQKQPRLSSLTRQCQGGGPGVCEGVSDHPTRVPNTAGRWCQAVKWPAWKAARVKWR